MVTAPASRRITLALTAAMALVVATGMMAVLGASRLKGPSRPAFLGFELVAGVLALVLLGRGVTRTLRQLTRANAFLESLVRAAPAAIVGIDRRGNVDVWNPAAERIFGWGADEVLGRPLRAIPPEERAGFEAIRARVAGRGEVITSLEHQRLRKDGSTFDARAAVGPRLGNGAPQGLIAIIEDVSEQKRASRMLRDSEERFRLTFEEAPIGMALVTLEGRFLRVNRALCDIVGYTPAELTGLTFQGITHPADLEKDLELAGRLARGEIPRYQLEKRYIRKDGAVVDILLGGSVVRAPDGTPLYFISQVVDLTQRRRVEERSRLNEEALARAQRVAHLGSWERDLRTNEVWRSPEVYAIYGAEPGPETDRPDALVELVHPADRRKVAEAVADSARTGAPFELEHRVVRPDGTERFVRLRGECTLEDGVPTRMTGTILDVTDLRRAEREREASLGWLRQVLAQSPAGMILVHGREGDRIEMNERAQRMIGRPITAIGQYPDLLVTLDGRPVPRDELPSTRALRGERINWAEYMLRSARGDSIPVAAGAAPVLDETGAVQGAIVIFQDITAVKDLERLRAEWNSLIAHDLRQPLSAITLSAQVLAKRAESPRARAAAEQIASAAGRLGRMINDLLDLSRLDARQLALVRERVDLGLMVRSAAARAELASPEGRFDLRCPDELPPVEADPDRIAQVLDNLLTNAVKYGEPGAPVLVEVEATASELAVAVTNRGRGIAARELPQLFRRFHRSDESRRSGVKGIGLGLHITRALIEAHGGRITVESTPGESTRFRFTLPRP